MKNHVKKQYLVLADSQPVEGVPETIRLLPLGHVKSQKGDFVVDAQSYEEMRQRMAGRGIDIVIDYEHQTLKDVQAPAAGWIKELQLTEDAICGLVEWTPKAKEYLANREYRYLSPVVLVGGPERKALVLSSAGLTNIPAIDGMFPIINSLDLSTFNFEENGEEDMALLLQLAALLGLPETATEEEVVAAVKKATEKPATPELVANKAILSLLALKDDASTAEVAAKITHLQNPANFVPVEQYNQLALKLNAQESTGLVELALKEGKITPAQKQWADEYVKADKEGFEQFMKLAVPVVPMEQYALSSKTPAAKRAETLDPVICKALDIEPEALAKYGKEDA